MTLHTEIHEQPAVLERLLRTQRNAVETIARALQSHDIRYVYLAARGTSYNAARYSNYLWGICNGLPVAFAAPSMFTYYNQPPSLKNGFVVGISQSGRSPDIVSVLLESKKQGRPTLAITNDVKSPLAEAADFVLDIQAGNEYAIAATKTYTAQLMAIAMLSAAFAQDEIRWNELNAIPQLVRKALTQEESIRQTVHPYRSISDCVVLGRGFSYATACEWALKLKEIAHVQAQAYSSADFLHGPIAMVDKESPILAVVPSGAVYDSMIEVLKELRKRSARLIIVSGEKDAFQLAKSFLPLPSNVPEWASPLVSIVPAQLFSYHLAIEKGMDPASSHGLHKITETT